MGHIYIYSYSYSPWLKPPTSYWRHLWSNRDHYWRFQMGMVISWRLGIKKRGKLWIHKQVFLSPLYEEDYLSRMSWGVSKCKWHVHPNKLQKLWQWHRKTHGLLARHPTLSSIDVGDPLPAVTKWKKHIFSTRFRGYQSRGQRWKVNPKW